ncbi:S-layer homology domain-containing protein [Serpentinicella alkaliphila]|uniref:S-layer family protein n=1 Tax=Serpentinicella alkaliphila TaxID=1734049 RepID=A0A4R2TDQ2_9FIRM|nr:S-layer homology domain-containing protein [Serpentinicella alkaliphila]QUH25478.1 S-layer homology domain-containing protein [Serpentinicella alkaliphila]TCQ01600.1 S-layer family protein [Serpentinicella alkaliphila]
MTNGTTYTFTVQARNEEGTGPSSIPSNAVTPYKPSKGGSGGGSTTTTPASTDTSVKVLVNGKVENAGTVTTTTKGNQTVTTVKLDQQKLEQKLASEGYKAVVTIPVSTKSDIVIGELNGQMVKNMESKQAVLEIKTGAAIYTLPAQQINIDAISEQIGRNVALHDIKIQVEIAKSTEETVKVVENSRKKGGFTIVAAPIDFTIKGIYDGKAVEISKFNAYVERLMAIPEGIDPSKVTTGIVVEADGTVRHVPTEVIVIDGKYYAKINSLTNSTYSVVWHPLEFKDAENHWAKAAINDMGSRMVVSGVDNDMYEPDRDITRAEFAAIMVRALGLKPGEGMNPFEDVKVSDWYSDYIETAVAYKIISGYGNGNFGPMDKITREQAMTMISRAMNITELKAELVNGEIEKLLEGFGDGVQSADYAKRAIAACVKSGIVSGRSDNMIAPKDNITRAKVAAIMQRLLKKSKLI